MEAYAILIVIYMVMAGINAVRKSGNGGKRRGAPPAARGPQQGRRSGQRQAGRPAQTIPAQSPRGTEQMPPSQGRPSAGSRRGQPLPAPGQSAASASGIPPVPSFPRSGRTVEGQAARKAPQTPGQGAGLPKTASQAELTAAKTPAKAPAKGAVGDGGPVLKGNIPLDLRQGMIWSQILGEPRSRQSRRGRAGRAN